MPPNARQLSPEAQALNDIWEKHVGAEFVARDAKDAVSTMAAHPRVNNIPVMTGGDGRDQVFEFYSKVFLRQMPDDIELVSVSRTIGQDRLVDELVARFTHNLAMDWLLPGVPPTGKKVEIALVAIVQFEDAKVKQENLYWDQASLLVQLGLIDPALLPVVGVEGPQSVLDTSLPLNRLLGRAPA